MIVDILYIKCIFCRHQCSWRVKATESKYQWLRCERQYRKRTFWWNSSGTWTWYKQCLCAEDTAQSWCFIPEKCKLHAWTVQVHQI